MAKKVQLSKKINGVAHQIYPKTVYDVVVDKNGKTLLLDIEAINSDLERIEESIPTKLSDLQGVAEIVTESEINTKLDNYYTKEEVDSKLENIESGTVDLENYYTKDLVYTKTEVDNKFKDVSSTADLKNYYTKDEVYNKDEVIELIDQAQFPEGGEINLSNYYNRGEVDGLLLGKQNTLESGVNIKKINGKSILGSGNIDISGEGSSIEIITADDTTTSPTDSNVYSALKVNNEFTRNNEKETIGAQWLFLDLTVFEDHIQSPDYTGNVLGSGWYLGFDNGTNSHLEVDTLKVRKKAIFDTLEIKHVAHVGGEIMLTPAGATIELTRKLTSNDFEGAYKDHFICYIKTTDSEGNVIENQFAEDDLVMCKTFNVVKKVDENGNAIVNNTYYWRKCIKVGIEEETKKSYIILSDSDKDAISDEPKAGDVIVTVGNSDSLNKSDRQNAIVISAYSSDAPSICLYQGIGTPDDKNDNNIYSLRDDIMPVRISPKGNKFTGNFIIENKEDVAGSLVQVLESLISFSVTGLSYNELLGVDAVARQVESGSNYVIYSLKEDVVKTWQQGDNVAIKLRFNELALLNKTNITISLLDGLEGKFDVNNDGENEQTIEAEDLENPSIKLFLKNGNEFDSDTFRIKITGSENCLPYSVEARAGFNTELRRTGIDIEDGTITLQAGNTLVKTQDGQKTLAKFTEDLISLKIQEGVYTEENGIDVVDSISYNTSTKSSTITLNGGTSTWRTGDVIEVLLEMESYGPDPKLTLPPLFTPKTITLDTKKFNHEPKAFTVNLNITGTVSMQVGGKVKSAKVYRVLKYELKNTGIDIESGQITLNADTTKIKDGDDVFNIATFTKNLIDLSTYDEITNYIYEYNVVDGIREYNSYNSYSIIDLNKSILNTWEVGDVIDILLETNALFSGGVEIRLGENIYFDTIITQPEDNQPNLIKTLITLTEGFDSDDTPRIYVQLLNLVKIDSAKVRRVKLESKLNRTGINIADGKITLDAGGTYIKTGDGEVTLAKFTQDQIDLGVQGEVFDYAYEEDAVHSIVGPTIYGDYTVNFKSSVAKDWKYGDVVQLTINFINPVTDTLSISPIEGSPFGDLGTLAVLEKIKNTLLDSVNKVLIPLVFKNNPGTITDVEDYFECLALLFSDHTLSIISSIEARREILVSEFKRTSIDILNGKITLDADNTTIKDTDLTLALFTKDLASISVYETIYNRVDGANAVTDTVTSGKNYQVFSLNKDIINLWKIGDVVEFTLSLTGSLGANQTITVFGVKGLENAIAEKVIPNTMFVNNIAQWTTKLDMSISDIGSLQNPAIRVLFNNNNKINCTLTAKCSLKLDLKRTGIDIESGLITLDADKTVIKDGNDSFDIASFTKNLITLLTESEGNAASDTNSYGKASELISGSGVVYYRDYDLNREIVSKWKKGEIINMSFVIKRLSFGNSKITVEGIGALDGILSTTEIHHPLGARVVQCSILCLKDAAHLATSDDLKLRIAAGFNNELGNLEIYSKLYGEIKKAGIDLNDGTITLNADTTKIKSGERDIALFTVNDKGVAVLNTEFIDADRIETNKLETEGTIKTSGQKVNYLTVSDDNLTVYNDLAVPKVKIHSGTLNSSGGTETIDYKTGLTVFPDEREFELVIAENILAQSSNNYITFSNVTIDLNWKTLGLSNNKSILTYDVVLRGSDSNETSLLRNLTIEPSITLVRKTITLPSKTLSTNKKYSLIIKFMKLPDGHSIAVSPNSGAATINYPQNLSEIASNGYNFLFGSGKYLTAREGGFEIVYGGYGFKISADGIYVKKPKDDDWVSLFGGIV